ncbi:MAG: cobyric acid synthase [Proteobacteria bacterium]|nr:cobyric acid synthase [Pseudomonadota bacterium]
MLQGTGSDVGKSVLAAGLCRACLKRGLSVRPFKPQNMSNNAAVTDDGGEIGRAQALQARAAGVAPSVHMNPVLLKPASDIGAQVVVRGRVEATADARAYHTLKPTLLPRVMESFNLLRGAADIVIVEGAGSPAEANLRAGDIANMGFALAADVPVVLIGDIERGGVLASLVGTHALLADDERALVAGYIVNKFRGDATLFDAAVAIIGSHTGWSSFGVVPWFDGARYLPKEDALALDYGAPPEHQGRVVIAVPRLSRIANFDDLDPLAAEPDVDLRLVQPGEALPGDADLVLLPGSKATLADLAFLRAQGWDTDIAAHHRRGGVVVGLCGGYQMLGRRITDLNGVEGPKGEAQGLGLLEVETVLAADKTLGRAAGTETGSGEAVHGYEIHLGETAGPDRRRPWLTLEDGRLEGAVSADGRVMGCYVHGLFAADGFRRSFLRRLGASVFAEKADAARIETALDGLAAHIEAHLDIDALLAAAR